MLGASRSTVANVVMPTLLDPGGGPLADVEYRLFLYAEERQRLLPAFEPGDGDEPSEGWRPGTGTVGHAWATGSYIAVEGPAASDETLGWTLLSKPNMLTWWRWRRCLSMMTMGMSRHPRRVQQGPGDLTPRASSRETPVPRR